MGRPGVKHSFKEFVLDPIPDKLWRNATPVPGTKVGFCETCGFFHVHPYFDEAYLTKHYTTYEMPTAQANLAETARMLAANLTDKNAKIVDLGCGDGFFLNELHRLGFTDLYGVDQSPGLERAKKLGFGKFEHLSVWDYLDQKEKAGGTDAQVLVMVNVLEHVAEPMELLKRIQRILPPKGFLCITVPNDFSPLQQAFLKVKGHLPWFVCVPDHLNYFSFDTLRGALGKVGFDIVDESALYPLELYLLQDLDYIADPALGPVAHQRRVLFENNMKKAGMTGTLDHFYRTLAKGGYGRDIMMMAQKNGAHS